jgi:hypothetical protein
MSKTSCKSVFSEEMKFQVSEKARLPGKSNGGEPGKWTEFEFTGKKKMESQKA